MPLADVVLFNLISSLSVKFLKSFRMLLRHGLFLKPERPGDGLFNFAPYRQALVFKEGTQAFPLLVLVYLLLV